MNNKGFTIIEVIIALSVLLIGMTGVVRMYGAGASMGRSSSEYIYAQNLAKKIVAEKSTDKLNLNTGNTSYNFYFKNISYVVACKITKNNIPKAIGKNGHDIYFINVDVSWSNQWGGNKNHVYSSAYAFKE